LCINAKSYVCITGYGEIAAVRDGEGTIDARYRVDAIGKGPCAGRNDVPRVDDIDGAVVAVGSRENAASRAGVGGRQRAAAVEIDVMVGVDGREIDRIARGVGACLGVYAVYEVVDACDSWQFASIWENQPAL
jgi:hypothetical protein